MPWPRALGSLPIGFGAGADVDRPVPHIETQERLIEVRGARLRVRTLGHGPAVLLLHGWTLDLDMWRGQFSALAGWRLIAFDRRGFGLSTGVPGIEQDLSDIDQVLAALDIERVAIVGMSQGARIALRWAIGAAQRTSCLVLDGPPRERSPAHGGAPDEIPLASYRELVAHQGIEAFRKLWLQQPFMRLHTSDPATHALLQQIVGRYPGLDLLVDDMLEPLRVADLRRLDVPVLVINGEYDSDERRAAGAQLACWLPNARLALIARAGHFPNLDNPVAYNRRLTEFLDSQAAQARVE